MSGHLARCACGEPAIVRRDDGRVVCAEHASGHVVEPLPASVANLLDLHARLVTFARGLAAEEYLEDYDTEITGEGQIGRAVAECKASIGRALLEALGEHQA